MSITSPVLLILGGGANVGQSVARAFSKEGYKVVSTSRSLPKDDVDGIDLHIQSDLSNPESVSEVFEKTTQAFGPPSVVVYNGAATTSSPEEDPLKLSVEDLNRNFQVNAASVLIAARESTNAFDKLPPESPRVFIYTGNILNSAPIPPLLSLGMGKSAAAHLISSASTVYQKKGYRFYYADERNSDGSAAYFNIDGEAHGEFYLSLAENKTKVPWLVTFVKGKGYQDFSK